MDQTQRRIMLFLPLFFVVFIINFPAGLIVYWITTNLWTIAQQYIVMRTVRARCRRRRRVPTGGRPPKPGDGAPKRGRRSAAGGPIVRETAAKAPRREGARAERRERQRLRRHGPQANENGRRGQGGRARWARAAGAPATVATAEHRASASGPSAQEEEFSAPAAGGERRGVGD